MPQTPYILHKHHLGSVTRLDGSAVFTPRSTRLDGSAVFTPRSVTPMAVTPRSITPQICARDSQLGARFYSARSPTPDHRQPFRPVIVGASSPPASVTQNLRAIFLPGRSGAENNVASPGGPTATWPWSQWSHCPTQGVSPQQHGHSSPTPLRRSSSPRSPPRWASALGLQRQESVACAAPAVASTQTSNCTSPEGAYAQIFLPPPEQRSVSNLQQVGCGSGAGTLLWCPESGTASSQGAVLQQQVAAAAATKDAAGATAPSQQQQGCQRMQTSPRSISPTARRKSPERFASSPFPASVEKEVLGDSRRRQWSPLAPKGPCAPPVVARDPRSPTMETSFTPAFMRLQEKLSHFTEEGTVSL